MIHDVPDMLEYVFRCSDIKMKGYERIKKTTLLFNPSNNKFQICIPDLDWKKTKTHTAPTRPTKSMINNETPKSPDIQKCMRLGAFNYAFCWAANGTRNSNSVCT